MRTVLAILALGLWALAQTPPTLPVLHRSDVQATEVPVEVISDVDGDGTRDLAIARGGGVDVVSLSTNTLAYTVPIAGLGMGPFDDLDGDGIDEWLLGSTADVHVINGATGIVMVTASLGPGPTFGARSVMRIDDIDGDGVADIVVGTVGLEWYSGQTGQPLLTYPGFLSSSEVFGLVGDVDDDGRDDIFARVPGAVLAGFMAPLGIFSSATGTLLLDLQPSGYDSAAPIGDINGDGLVDVAAALDARIDVLTGASFASPGGPQTLYSVTVEPLNPNNPLLFEGGVEVGPAGDANGDGVADWVIGQPSSFFPPQGRGSVSIRSGATGIELIRHQDDTIGLGLGGHLGGVVDANGDGFDDIVAAQVRGPVSPLPPTTPAGAFVFAVTGTNDYGPSTSEAVMTWNAGPSGARQAGSLDITDGLPFNDGALLVSLAPAAVSVGSPSFDVLVSILPGELMGILPLTLDGSGTLSLPFTLRSPAMSGVVLYWQFFDTLSNGALASTNGVETLFSN